MRFFLLLLLFACQSIQIPTYVRQNLSAIEIGNTSSIEEAELYGRLAQLLQPYGPSKYRLDFNLEYNESDLAVAKTSDILRKGLNQKVFFELTDKSSGKSLIKEQFTVYSSYSLIAEPMTSYAQQSSNKKLLAHNAAENIRYRLIVFFNKFHPEG